MGNIRNYDNWKESLPREQEPVMLCDSCGTELYTGDYYFQISTSERICEDCLNDFYRKETLGAENETKSAENETKDADIETKDAEGEEKNEG